ncbi:unnamed protein product [Sphagnum compactum]
MKLKFFREAEIELKQFENFEKPCFFYETYPNENPDRKGEFAANIELSQSASWFDESRLDPLSGSMVPFGLRMLNAELPLYLARSEESISNLYRLLQTTDLVIRELPRDNESADRCPNQIPLVEAFSIFGLPFQTRSRSGLPEARPACDVHRAYFRSLLKIVNGQYTEAFELLKEANELVPHNSTVREGLLESLFLDR